MPTLQSAVGKLDEALHVGGSYSHREAPSDMPKIRSVMMGYVPNASLHCRSAAIGNNGTI